MDTPILPQKCCSKCKKEYPATSEYFRPNGKGLRSDCRQCGREYNQRYKAEHPEKFREYHRRHYIKYADEIRAEHRQYAADNKEHKSEYDRQYYVEHAEQKIAQSCQYQDEHIEAKRANSRRYKIRHPEQANADWQRRRARKIGNGGSYTVADVRLQIKSQTDKNGKLRCWWCGKEIKLKHHIDHRIPLDKGGSNAPENIVIAHPRCNLSKGSKLPQEWNGRLL